MPTGGEQTRNGIELQLLSVSSRFLGEGYGDAP